MICLKVDVGSTLTAHLLYSKMTTAPAAPSTMKVLYNDCHGGFGFSKDFEDEYKLRTGNRIAYTRYYGYGSQSIRIDPVAIAIFEEKGSEWCSGEYCVLTLREIPTAFADYWTIEDYDGLETVQVNSDSALADVLEAYILSGDHGAMMDQYRRIKSALTQLRRLTSREEIDIPTDTATAPAV